MSYVWNRQSIELSLDILLCLSVSSSSLEITISLFLPLVTQKTAIVSYLTPLPFLSWRTPWTFSLLYFLPRVCWPIISTFLSCFDCFLVAELSPLASRSSYCSQEVNRHILLLPARLSMLSSPAADCQLRFCFVFCFLLCSVFGQKCGTLCGAQLFDFDCFVLIEMFLQLLPASLLLLLLAAGSATRRSRVDQSTAQLLSGLELVHNVRVW